MGDFCTYSGIELQAQETKDSELVARLIKEPEIIDGFTNATELQEYFNAFVSERHIYYVMKMNQEIVGVAVIMNMQDGDELPDTYIVDVGFFKKARGKIAKMLCIMALNNFINTHRVKKLYAFVDSKNKAAYLNAFWCGFKKISTVRDRTMLEYKYGRQ